MTKPSRSTIAVIAEFSVTGLLLVALLLTAYYQSVRDKEQQKQIQYIQDLVTRTDTGLIVSDNQGTIVSWSTGAENLFQYTSEEMVGKNIETIIPDEFRMKHRTSMARAVQEQKKDYTHVISCDVIRKDKAMVPVVVVVRSGFDDTRGVFMASIIQPAQTFKFTDLSGNKEPDTEK